MKAEYDFSKGERGKFYTRELDAEIPPIFWIKFLSDKSILRSWCDRERFRLSFK